MMKSPLTPEQEEEARAYLKWEHENMHFVVKIEHVGPYTLHLTFDDGTEKVINFHDFVYHPDAGRQYQKMQDLAYFHQVVLLDGHITWLFENDHAPLLRGWNFNPAMLYTWEGESWKEWLIR